PSGSCSSFCRPGRIIPLTVGPDFRSKAVGWESKGHQTPSIVSPECEPTAFSQCFVRGATVNVVVAQISQLSVSLRLRWLRLRVVNLEPTFGEAEDHGTQQIPQDPPIDCGLRNFICTALYEYGTQPVLDALSD